MDTLLVDGDFSLDSRGLPVTLAGDGELIQRALIRLSVRRGSFAADPALGSELHRLRGGRGGDLERLARSYVQEALAPLHQLTVEGVAVHRPGGEGLLVAVTVSHRGRQYQLEVEVS